eukprot:12795826-Alexandrium_andersonii.AAC.1
MAGLCLKHRQVINPFTLWPLLPPALFADSRAVSRASCNLKWSAWGLACQVRGFFPSHTAVAHPSGARGSRSQTYHRRQWD